MRLLTCCLSVIVLLAVSPFAGADPKSEAAARAKVIAPFVEEETTIVAHVDLARVDVEATIDFAARLAGLPASTVARAKQEATLLFKKAKEAGVKELYFVVAHSSDGNRGVLPTAHVVIPVSSATDIKAIRAILQRGDSFGRATQDVFVFPLPEGVPPPERQPGDFRAVARPELVTAFEAAGDSAVQVVLIPPPYAARVIEAVMPRFPDDLGGGPTTALTRGVSWAALGLDLPPRPAVRLTIQSADAAAAEALRDKLAELLRLAGKRSEVRIAVPKFDEVAAAIVPKVEGDRLVLVLNEQNEGIGRLVSLLTPPIEAARAAAMRMKSMNNLRQIAIGMFKYYESGKNHFPLPASVGKDGKPLLSWRVHILPYLGEGELYRQFHLDEPWDSPHNRTLIEKMPEAYRLPMSKSGPGQTNYLLPVGNGAAFEADKPTRVNDITDGTVNTVMVVEVDDNHAIVWTKPEDLAFDPKDPTKGLGRFAGGFNAATCDGFVRFFAWPTEPKKIETLGYLFMRADRQPVRADEL
jgi:hypothetical protein